jgi:hypothetical protein
LTKKNLAALIKSEEKCLSSLRGVSAVFLSLPKESSESSNWHRNKNKKTSAIFDGCYQTAFTASIPAEQKQPLFL